MSLSESIKALRKNANVSQAELAEKIGVAVTTVSGYEIGTRIPRIATIEKIAAFFGVSTSNLIGEECQVSDVEDSWPGIMILIRRASKLDVSTKQQIEQYISFALRNNH